MVSDADFLEFLSDGTECVMAQMIDAAVFDTFRYMARSLQKDATNSLVATEQLNRMLEHHLRALILARKSEPETSQEALRILEANALAGFAPSAGYYALNLHFGGTGEDCLAEAKIWYERAIAGDFLESVPHYLALVRSELSKGADREKYVRLAIRGVEADVPGCAVSLLEMVGDYQLDPNNTEFWCLKGIAAGDINAIFHFAQLFTATAPLQSQSMVTTLRELYAELLEESHRQ